MTIPAPAVASAPRSLLEVFRALPDPRRRRGRRYPAEAVLSLMAVAVMAGAKGWEDIAQFAADRPALAEALGLMRAGAADGVRRTPAPVTLLYFLRRYRAEDFEAALTTWLLECCGGDLPEDALDVDGKVLRGSRDGSLPGVRLPAAYGRRLGSAVAQVRVAADSAECKAALELLKVLPPAGSTVVGDAAFCHKGFAGAVTQAGGDYVLMVRDNQPGLKADIETAFAPAGSPSGGAAATR